MALADSDWSRHHGAGGGGDVTTLRIRTNAYVAAGGSGGGGGAGGGLADGLSPPRPSVQFIVKLLDFWKLEPPDAVGLLGFNVADADHVSAVLDGREQFRGRDTGDRIAHLLSIRATLSALFRDLQAENDWLREPHTMLDRKTPMSLLVGGSMEDLLLVREYVDTVAGR
ncbi:MAG: MbcA/ParS/Xre antitoxin family protein [Gammaproteobacteria bacterium]|nr:MbcA/ParS/Xre antitoxin family protein [Gammaproteobacteria bacterium]